MLLQGFNLPLEPTFTDDHSSGAGQHYNYEIPALFAKLSTSRSSVRILRVKTRPTQALTPA